jgi:aspartate kinase
VRARRAVADVVTALGAGDYLIDESIAKVSLVGAGMKTHPGVAAKMFSSLADAGVNLDLISTSPIRISCVIDASQITGAVQALHDAFGLSIEEISAEVAPPAGGGA